MERAKHPPELPILFFTEMWERFSFYLMIGILPQYLADSQKGGMGWSDQEAAVVVGSYMALVYFTPFIGGLLADRLLGLRKTIISGAFLMMLGHLALAWPGEIGLYLGLGFLILGNGAFKPNISTLLGNLYPPGSPLKDAGYNIFYMGINIGAFICNFVAALVRNYFDDHPLAVTSTWQIAGWHAAFATAAVGMLFGLLLFASSYGRLAKADPPPAEAGSPEERLTPLWVQCLLPALILGAVGWYLPDLFHRFPNLLGEFPLNRPTAAFIGACIPATVFYINIWRTLQDQADRGRVAALLVIFGVVIVFWAVFNLGSTALVVWARDDTSREPNAAVRIITDQFPEFAENAPPSYFFNAGPEVPRPDKDTFQLVSPERYEQMEKAQELTVVEGKPVYVTEDGVERIYANTTSDTPVLPRGKHLKLVNTELFQSINPGYVILFTPLVVMAWRVLRKRDQEPSTPGKIGLGVLIGGGAPLLMLGATIVSHDGASKVSPYWLFGYFVPLTVGELCLSPMGLSLVNKTAPAHLRAFMMGGWFLSTAIGNKLSGIFGEVYHQMDHKYFWIMLSASCVLVAGFIYSLLPWLNRQMGEQS
jgi:POT family proton-dependent oligopeptide transporter